MNGYNPFIALVLALIAFPLGLYVFAGMNKVVWDEEKEIVTAGRMDIIGFATLLLYIGFDIGLRTLLNVEIGNTLATTSYLLAAIGASLLGRSFGSLLAIQKLVHKEGIHT